MDDLKDLLDRIDDVTADVCGWCQTRLGSTAFSRTFCSQDHQARWHAQQAGVDPDPELLDHDLPMPAVRSRIASQLSQRLPGAQVYVNGREVHMHGLRIDHVFIDEAQPYVDETQPEIARRLLSGNWDFDVPVAIGTVFPAVLERTIELARVHMGSAALMITSDMIQTVMTAEEALARIINGLACNDNRLHEDVKARALRLRQNRNTGPAPQRGRPPKKLTL